MQSVAAILTEYRQSVLQQTGARWYHADYGVQGSASNPQEGLMLVKLKKIMAESV
jgi:hypothetical protein